MRCVVGSALLLGACFSKPPGPQEELQPPDAARADAAAQPDAEVPADAFVACTVVDDFSMNRTDCGTWASTAIVSPLVVRHTGGVLDITTAGPAGVASCNALTKTPFSAGAVIKFANLTNIVGVQAMFDVILDDDVTVFTVEILGTGGATPAYNVLRNGQVLQSANWDPVAMAYWRIAPSGNNLRISYGDTAATPNAPVTTSVTPGLLANATVRLRGTFSTQSQTQSIQFDDLDACP